MLTPSTIHLLTTSFPMSDPFLAPPAPAKRRRIGRRRAGDWVR